MILCHQQIDKTTSNEPFGLKKKTFNTGNMLCAYMLLSNSTLMSDERWENEERRLIYINSFPAKYVQLFQNQNGINNCARCIHKKQLLRVLQGVEEASEIRFRLHFSHPQPWKQL